jgi:hypothetical protein
MITFIVDKMNTIVIWNRKLNEKGTQKIIKYLLWHRIQSLSVQVDLSGNWSDYVSRLTHFGFSPIRYYPRAWIQKSILFATSPVTRRIHGGDQRTNMNIAGLFQMVMRSSHLRSRMCFALHFSMVPLLSRAYIRFKCQNGYIVQKIYFKMKNFLAGDESTSEVMNMWQNPKRFRGTF